MSPDRARLPEYRALQDLTFEIQVRTIVQHAWAEFEHDVRYKVETPTARRAELDRHFLLAAALIEMTDNEFSRIDSIYNELKQESMADSLPQVPSTSEPSLDAPQLAAYVSRRYPDAPRSKKDHYDWMIAVLDSCGVTKISSLDGVLAEVDSEAVAGVMGHKFPAGHVRRLDDDLLAAMGDQYAQASLSGSTNISDRERLLKYRMQKLRSAGLAKEG